MIRPSLLWANIRAIIPTLLITLPRHALAYPFYVLSSVILIDYKSTDRRSYYILAGLLIWLGLAFLISSSQNNLSPTAFILELALLLPLLIFLSGFQFTFSRSDALLSIRLINLICLLYGVLSLIEHGFPLQLPYRDFLSDAYWGPYGWGGARIVTIIGFTGLALEISAAGFSRWRVVWLLLALTNFILPSYILGICCGLAALCFIALKKPWPFLFLCITLIPAGIFALDRLEWVNPAINGPTGWHPKILAHFLVLDLFSQEKLTLVSGTGLGQFTSTPQIWTSNVLSVVSYQSTPSLLGLFSSEYNLRYVEPVIISVEQASYHMGSALSKPHTGFTTLLAETGIAFFLMTYLFLRRSWEICSQNIMALPFYAFFIALNTIDLWIDNLWLGYCLILTTAFFTPQNEASRALPST